MEYGNFGQLRATGFKPLLARQDPAQCLAAVLASNGAQWRHFWITNAFSKGLANFRAAVRVSIVTESKASKK